VGRTSDIESLADSENLPALPPVIAGAFTPEIKERVENFFHSVASIFEAWIGRRKSALISPCLPCFHGDLSRC
jgi:hypothetical protein